MPMNPELKARWIAALESGEYSQTTGRLRYGNSYCCLGVLCDLSGQGKWAEVLGQYQYAAEDDTWSDSSRVPGAVLRHIGLDPNIPVDENDTIRIPWDLITDEMMERLGFDDCVRKKLNPGGCSLISLNDMGFTFKEIAALIKASPL